MNAWNYPVFFERNRVYRVYLGGELFRDFLGDTDGDGFHPEEWVASTVKALNANQTDPLEGLSLVEGTKQPFPELIATNKKAFLGDRDDLGVLVKYLDSAIRLPMQVHPTREFSKIHFGSPYGKAESWYILATRPGASIYFGFTHEISYEELEKAVNTNMENPDSFLGFVHRIEVKPGDVFFVPAGVIHAIGAGCLLLEAQEPTDFTVQPEVHCGDYILNDHEMYLGLDKQIALSCFDRSLHGEAVLAMGKKEPRIVEQTKTMTRESLISEEDTPCFTVDRIRLTDGETTLPTTAAVYVIASGEGTLQGEGYNRNVKKGDYFFLPFEAKNITAQGTMEIVICKGNS